MLYIPKLQADSDDIYGEHQGMSQLFWRGKFFLEYSSFVEISAKNVFFSVVGKSDFGHLTRKIRHFGEKWLFSTNMLDSGQNSLKTPYTIFRSLISADLSKIEKKRKKDFWQKLANFLHKISDSKIKNSQFDDFAS